MRTYKNLHELRAAAGRVKSGVAGDTIFGAAALLFIAETLKKIEASRGSQRKRRRKSSAWQRFFTSGIRSGKTAKQVAAEWKARRIDAD